jgi:hypothetical protein
VVAISAIAAQKRPIAVFPFFLGAVVLATIGWIHAWRLASRSSSPGTLSLVLAVAALGRGLLLLPDEPLSDDLYRYLWDGRVADSGENPFEHAPSSVALEALRDDEIWPRINHPEIPTIYPAVAQMLFRGLDALSATPRGVRAAAALFDLGATALLALALIRRGRPPALAVAHALCPVAMMESALGGHVDSLGAPLLLGGLLLALVDPHSGESRAVLARSLVAGVILGLSAQIKPVAVVLVPVLLLGVPSKQRALLLAGGALSLVALLPYLEAGPKLWTGFLAYAEHWDANDLLLSPLVATGLSPRAARIVLALLLALVAFLVPWRVSDRLAASGSVLLALLTLSPTVHPWYASWFVPFLVFLPREVLPSGVALVAMLPVTYVSAWLARQTGVWAEPEWLRAALWGPVAAALFFGWMRERAFASRTSALETPPGGTG